MSLFNRFRKKTKKEKIEKIDKEKPEEKPKKEEPKEKPKEEVEKEVSDKETSKKVVPRADKEQTIQAYQVIKSPHITEKAGFLNEQNKYVFKVTSKANKIEVKKAIEILYKVKVEKVNIIHLAPKKRRLGRHEGWRGGLKKGFKKAVVTLKEGEKIEILPR